MNCLDTTKHRLALVFFFCACVAIQFSCSKDGAKPKSEGFKTFQSVAEINSMHKKAAQRRPKKNMSPIVLLKTYRDLADTLFNNLSRTDKDVLEKLRELIDVSFLATEALQPKDIVKLKDTKQYEPYTTTFVALLEKTYIKKSRDVFGMHEFDFETSTKAPSDDRTVVVGHANGRVVRYHLYKDNTNEWWVFNVDIGGIDLLENYQKQFKEIIDQRNDPALLVEALKKRLKTMSE